MKTRRQLCLPIRVTAITNRLYFHFHEQQQNNRSKWPISQYIAISAKSITATGAHLPRTSNLLFMNALFRDPRATSTTPRPSGRHSMNIFFPLADQGNYEMQQAAFRHLACRATHEMHQFHLEIFKQAAHWN